MKHTLPVYLRFLLILLIAPTIGNAQISHASDAWPSSLCLPLSDPYFVFSLEGDYPENTRYELQLSDADGNFDNYLVIGSRIGAGDHIIEALNLNPFLPYGTGYSYRFAAYNEGIEDFSSESSPIEIIPQANLESPGIKDGYNHLRLCADAEGEVKIENSQIGAIYYIESNDDIDLPPTEFIHGTGGTISIPIPATFDDGTYTVKVFTATMEGLTCDGPRNFGIIEIQRIGELNIRVKDDEDHRLQPEEDGVYRFCETEHGSLYLPNLPDASYHWFKNGVRLDHINIRANAIGVRVDDAGRMGPGRYHARIIFGQSDGCSMYTPEVDIRFLDAPERPEISLNRAPEFCPNEGPLRISGPEGYARYTWYRNEQIVHRGSNRELMVSREGAYSLVVESEAGCPSRRSREELIVAYEAPAEKVVSAQESLLCRSGQSRVVVHNSDPGVWYQLKDADRNIYYGGRASGNGGDLFLYTGILNSSVEMNIVATDKMAGCQSVFGFVSILVDLTEVTITRQDHLLVATEGTAYQWYYDGRMLHGKTSRTLRPDEPGVYTVKITTLMGCRKWSDEYSYMPTNVNLAKNASVNVYPNPFTDILNISTSNTDYTGEIILTVYDIVGNRVMGEKVDAGSFTNKELNLSGLNAGTYFLHVINQERNSVIKLIKH
ncbi:MAG: T9SS type A sorting domain-containing protein [Cytophagaceae bacterium]